LVSIALILHSGNAFTFERIDKNNSMLLVVDHQLGLFQLVRDFGPDEYRNNILAHAAVGKVFNLPTILTTSAETGSPCSIFCDQRY
jgi:nicotinamidase-related amidase